MQEISPFLMFTGKAEEAMNFYVAVFPNSGVTSLVLDGADEEGAAGTVRHAAFTLNGRRFMCIDSPVEHAFTLTPAISLHVSFDIEAEVDAVYAALSEGGQIFMPLGSYPFSRKYVWLSDRFGVSWQLMLAEA